MGDRDQRIEQDCRVVELVAEALHAKAHALLEDGDVVVIGKDDDAGVQVAFLQFRQNAAAVHVR